MGPFAKAVHEENTRWQRRPGDTFVSWKLRIFEFCESATLTPQMISEIGWAFFEVTDFIATGPATWIYLHGMVERQKNKALMLFTKTRTFIVFEDADDAVREKLALPNMDDE